VSLRSTLASSSPGRRRLWRRSQALAGCVAVVAACAGCGETDAPAPAGSVLGGPVQMLVTAQSVDGMGNPVGVTAFYPPGAKAVTAVAVLGQLHGPQSLVMTWSRLTGQGPQILLTRRLTVTSYGRAYTTAVPAKPMAYGTYQVSVSVDGVTRTIEWGVYASRHTAAADFSQPTTPLTAGPAAALPQPPQPGPSKWCDSQHAITSMSGPSELELNIAAVCPVAGQNKVTRGTVLATMSRTQGVQLVGMLRMQPGGVLAGSFRFNVCGLAGGSDVPGARVDITTIVYYLGATRSFSFSTGLPAELLGPRVSISSSVAPGTPVTPGEKIRLRVTASEPDQLGTQVGIGNLKVYGADGLIKFVRFPRMQTGCQKGRGYRVVTFTYRVPDTAPKVIKISAVSSDLTGAKATAGISFPFAG
jgi:hypothetical protein